jgi:hypothetical protein
MIIAHQTIGSHLSQLQRDLWVWCLMRWEGSYFCKTNLVGPNNLDFNPKRYIDCDIKIRHDDFLLQQESNLYNKTNQFSTHN